MLCMLRDQASTLSLPLPTPISLAHDERAAANGTCENQARGRIVKATAPLINCMGRLVQLIRDLFGVKCSETDALRRLLRSDRMASTPPKVGEADGGLIRKCAQGHFLAIWGAVTDLIVYCKIAILRRRA